MMMNPRIPMNKRMPYRMTHVHAIQKSTIFQMNPPCGQVTLEDVDDIYPICNNIPDKKQRYACYACYGMDMEKVEKYYHPVKQMQQQMQQQTKLERRTILDLHIGRFHINICMN